MIDCVNSPLDQRLLLAAEDVSTTLPPVQKVVGPLAEIVGVTGIGFRVIVVAAELAEEHPPTVWVTVYGPAAETVIDCVTAPVDQVFPVAAEEVSTTLPPVQKVVGPPAVIVGVAGTA